MTRSSSAASLQLAAAWMPVRLLRYDMGVLERNELASLEMRADAAYGRGVTGCMGAGLGLKNPDF